MDRRERLNAIFSQFDRSANDFCRESGGLLCEISSSYKGEETPENLENRFARIYYASHIIVYKYTAHGMLGTVHGILDCLVCFGKAETDLPIPLPLAADYFDEDITAPMSIPFISNERAMVQAFACLGNTVTRLMPKISAASYDEAQKQAIDGYFFEEYTAVTGNPKDEIAVSAYFFNWMTMHFSSLAYLLAIKGKAEKAAKELQKCKEKFRCEKRLLNLWQSGKTTDVSEIPEIVSNLEWISDSGTAKTDRREFLPLLVSWFVLTVPCAAVYLGLYFLLIFLQQRGSVYLTGVMQNLPYGILAGFLTAIPVSYFTRTRFVRLLCKKDYEKLEEMDHIANGGGADRLMRIFLFIVAAACIVFTVLVSTWNLNFKKDGFVDNTRFFSVTGTHYEYREIDRVKYVPDRVNGLDQTLDYPSYALVLKNGKEIDLYGYDEIENYEQVLIGFLREQGVPMEK